jgi:uncharacterized protein with GYD domain
MNDIEKNEKINDTCPSLKKQIGKTTYIVYAHFSDKAKETLNDKIKRMLREEICKM